MKAGRCGFEYRGLPSCASPPLCFLHLLWWQQQLSASAEPFVHPLDALPPAAGVLGLASAARCWAPCFST